MSTKIQTKHGTAIIGNHGYLEISSVKEGNKGKLLHRLVFEDFYQITLPSNILIHHEDGNKLNNKIWNLVPMTRKEHNKLHGQNRTLEYKQKMSKTMKNRILSDNHKRKISAKSNTTGFYRVSIREINGRRYYRYMYLINKKRKEISSTSLLQLKDKVIEKGFEWLVINEKQAKETCRKIGVNYESAS